MNLLSENKHVFHALRDLDLHMSYNDNHKSFCNEDLMRFKCLPQLEKLNLCISPNYITLHGAIQLIRQCANLTHLSLFTFVQFDGPDDGDIYKKFRQAFEKLHNIPKRIYWCRLTGYKFFCTSNLLDVLKDVSK